MKDSDAKLQIQRQRPNIAGLTENRLVIKSLFSYERDSFFGANVSYLNTF